MPNNPLTPQELLTYLQASAQNGINPPALPFGYVYATPPTTDGGIALRKFDAAYISTGIIDPNRLGTGATGAGNLYLADDGTWKPVSGGGGGGGDMYKSTYDVDNDGVVDSAERIQIIVRNSTGSTLTKGTVVYLIGATGNRPNAVRAQANSEATSSKTFGFVVSDIANNADGYVACAGTLHDLDTSAFADGVALWLSPTVAGGWTTTVPTEPNHSVFLGWVARSHPTQGRVVLHIQNGYELNELHDVNVPSPTNGDLLQWDSVNAYWKNVAVATAVPTPTLAQVTTAGNTTTNHINVGTLGINTNPIGSDSFAGNSVFSIVAPAGSRERLIYAKVADSDSYFSVFNTTSVSGQFLPMFAGYHPAGQDRTGMLFHAAVPDVGTKPALSFRASQNDYDATITTRPLFSFGGGIGGNTSKMMIWGDGTVAMGDNVGGVEINNTKPQVKLYVEGNVGIGTTTDAGYKLDVNGTARVTGNITLNSNLYLSAAVPIIEAIGTNGVLTLQSASSNSAAIKTVTNIFDFKDQNNTNTLLRVHTYNNYVTIGGNTNAGALLNVIGSKTATSALAQGVFFNNTLVAAANNDVLVGLDINPTFTNGSFTGVSNVALRTQTGNVLLATTSGNVLIGTTTDAGYKLDVNGGNFNNAFRVTGYARFTGATNTTGVYIDNGLQIGSTIFLGQYTFAPYMNITSSSVSTNWGTVAFNTNNINAGDPSIILTSSPTNKGFNLGSTISGNSWATMKYFFDDGSMVLQYSASSIDRVASSLLTLNSTIKGFLQPRMTNTEAVAISTPATGLQVYDTTNNKNLLYNGSVWQNIATESWVSAQGYAVGTPTLQQVTTAGNITTNAVRVEIASGDGLFLKAATSGVSYPLIMAADSAGRGFVIGSSALTFTSRATYGVQFNVRSNYSEIQAYTDISIGTPYPFIINPTGGDVLIGTTTISGFKLDVNGSTRIKGTGTTSATNALIVQNSAGTSSLTVGDNGKVYAYDSVYVGSGGPASSLKISGTNISTHYYDALNGGIRWINNTRFILYGAAAPGFPVESYNIITANGGNNAVHVFGTYTDDTEIISALVEIRSTTRGFLQSRMTNAQVLAIATPATGLQAYDTTNNKNVLYNGTAWQNIATESWVTAQGYLTSVTETDTLQSVTNRGATTTNPITVHTLYIGKGGGNEETNTAVGYNALVSNTVPYYGAGFRNTAFGYSTLSSNTIGSYNTVVGRSAGASNTTGSNNIFIGDGAGEQNIAGNSNVYIGNTSGGNQTTSQNTYVGGAAGYSAVAGTGYSTYIGYLAGHATIGGDNVFLGHRAGFGSTNSNWFIIGNRNNASLIEGNFSTGNVMIGTSTDSGFKLDVNGTIRSSGVITATGGNSTNWNTAFGWGNHASAGYLTTQPWVVSGSDIYYTTGNVGIGTSTPTEKLHIVDGAAANIFARISATNANATAAWVAQNDQTDNIVYRVFGSTVSGSQLGQTLPRSASLLANLGGSGAFLVGTFSSTNLILGTSNAERMRIFANGNITINSTTDAGYRLDVNGSLRTFNLFYVQGGSANWNETTPGTSVGSIHLNPGNTTDNYGSAITFGASDYSDGNNAQAGIYVRSDGTYGTKMYFATTDAYVSGSKTRMMIDHTGKVGIATSSPGYTLDVNGNFNSGPASIGVGSASFDTQSNNRALTLRGDLVVGGTGLASAKIVLGAINSTKYLEIGSDGTGPYFYGTTVLDLRFTTYTGGLYVTTNYYSYFTNNLAVGGNANAGSRALVVNGTFGTTDAASIGTLTNPVRFLVGAKVVDDNNYTYDTNTAMVVHQTATATATLNDPKEVLILARQGTAGQAFGAAAALELSRYENSGVASRTRLDFKLADGSFLSASTRVMTMLSNGNVGIGTTSPEARLHTNGNILVKNTDGFPRVMIRGTYPGLLFASDDNTTQFGFITTIQEYGSNPWGNLAITSRTGLYIYIQSFSGSVPAMSFLGGNVQVGNNVDAGYKFDVAGSLRTTGITYANGGLAVNSSSGYIGSANQKLLVNGSGRIDASSVSYGEGLALNFPTSGVSYGGIFMHSTTNALDGFSASSIKFALTYNYAPETGVGNGGFAIHQSNSTTRLFINSSGNIGIGTTSPNAPLQVNGTGGDNTPMVRYSGSAATTFNWLTSGLHPSLGGGQTSLHIFGKANSQYNSAWVGYLHSSDGSSNNVLSFGMYGANHLMNLNGSGNLGLGTASPTQGKLVIFAPDESVMSAISIRQSNDSTYGMDFGLDQTINGHGYFYSVAGNNKYEFLQFKRTNIPDVYLVATGGKVGIYNTNPTAQLTISTPNGYDGTILQLQSRSEPNNYHLKVNEVVTDGVVRWSFDVYNQGAYNNMLVFDRAKLGIGTSNPSVKVHIGARIIHESGYVHDANALQIAHQTGTGSSVLNDPKEVLILSRQGTGYQSTGAGAAFEISRYEHTATYDARTRLDIKLAHGDYFNQSTRVMTMLSSGNIGIGTTAPAYILDVNGGDINVSGAYRVGGTVGYTGVITIPANPPGMQNIQVNGGIITGVF